MAMKQKVGLSIVIISFLVAGVYGESLAQKELKLIVADYLPPAYDDYFPATQIFVDQANKIGKGKVKIELFHSGKLLQARSSSPD